eukprot:2126866-Amphidinium_carterae.1
MLKAVLRTRRVKASQKHPLCALELDCQHPHKKLVVYCIHGRFHAPACLEGNSPLRILHVVLSSLDSTCKSGWQNSQRHGWCRANEEDDP